MVRSVVFAKYGDKLYSGSFDYTIKIWNTSSPDAKDWAVRKTLVGHKGGIRCLSESPCGRFLTSGADDKSIKMWDVAFGAKLRTIKNPNASKGGKICGVRFLEGGKIISFSENGKAKLWNMSTRGEAILDFVGHKEAINAVAINADGYTLVSWGNDDSVRVWDAKTGDFKMTL